MENADNTVQNKNQALESHEPQTDHLVKEKHNRLFQRGCKWMGIGAAIMGISFGINFLLFNSTESFVPIMYILTSLGAVCIMKGLMDIFGGF